MRKEEILIIGREDIIDKSKGKDILLIGYDDLNLREEPVRTNTIILFIDTNGDTKIIKNRYGDKGVNMFIRTIEQIKIDNDVCIGLNTNFGEEYFDNIISIYSFRRRIF